MGPVCVNCPHIVSDIFDKVLIGSDILLCNPSGQADIVHSEKKMLYQGHSIPLALVQGPVVR